MSRRVLTRRRKIPKFLNTPGQWTCHVTMDLSPRNLPRIMHYSGPGGSIVLPKKPCKPRQYRPPMPRGARCEDTERHGPKLDCVILRHFSDGLSHLYDVILCHVLIDRHSNARFQDSLGFRTLYFCIIHVR